MSRYKYVVVVLLILGISISSLCIMSYIHKYYIRIIKVKKLDTIESPDKQYILITYDTSGGATSPFSVGAEVISSEGDFHKTIFKAQFEKDINAFWIDSFTVNINGIILDIRYDTFNNVRLNYKQQRYDTYNRAALRRKKPSNAIEVLIDNWLCH